MSNEARLTVYTKPNCPMCKATQRWLDKNNIPYITKPITPDIAQWAKDNGIKTAPIVILNATDLTISWGGYHPDHLKALKTTPPTLTEVAQQSRASAAKLGGGQENPNRSTIER